MAENFYTILTNTGKAKLANAQALGTTVQFSSIAVGDGSGNYYDPTESQTALKNEVWRGAINQIKTDSENPNWIVVEVVIPTTTGGFTVREAGIIDSEGDVIAIGKYPATYKPALAEGSGKDLYIRMILEVSNASAITLKIDPAVVLSTRGYVDDSLATHNANSAAHNNLPYLKTAEVVTSPEPNKVLKLDANGKLPSDVTGDAQSLGGKLSSDFWQVADAPFLFETNGYQKFPSGLILQWGTVSATTTGANIMFPIAFPAGVLSIAAMDFGLPANRYVQSYNDLSKTGFTAYGANDTDVFSYIAIGY